jgi:hypothetical protein
VQRLFKDHARLEPTAQIEAFTDTWRWNPDIEAAYNELTMSAPTKVADAIAAMRSMLTQNDVMAYLVMMTQRLLEIRRVLRPTGSMFLARDLEGTLSAEKADIGILITLTDPTAGVQAVIDRGGLYTHPANGQTFPRFQTYTIAQLLAGMKPQVPPTLSPYLSAPKAAADASTTGL